MANELFIKHKLVDEIPSSPEVGSIYYERKTGIEKVVESNASIVEVGNIEKMLSAKIGEGQNSNIFNDLDNVASGDNSHAEGSNTTASGQCAHTEGSSTTASGAFAHAEGYNTVAAGDYSHAEGYGTVTNNTSEHAEGSWNISTDNTIFSIGNGTDAENRSNLYEVHSDGSVFVKNVGDYNGTNAENATDLATILNDTVDKVNTINTTIFQTKTDESLSTKDKTIVGAINEVNSKPIGVGKIDPDSDGTGEIFNLIEKDIFNIINKATGIHSHAEGYGTTASGDKSHAEGYGTNATGHNSHAEGNYTNATGYVSHAEGDYSYAEGDYSHAEGSRTTAEGRVSHAEGYSTTATGSYSHAEGNNTKTNNQAEHAQGSYNISNTGEIDDLNTLHSIGIGTSDTERKNAQEVMLNGDHYIINIGGYDGTNPSESKTVQEVINELNATNNQLKQALPVYARFDKVTLIPLNKQDDIFDDSAAASLTSYTIEEFTSLTNITKEFILGLFNGFHDSIIIYDFKSGKPSYKSTIASAGILDDTGLDPIYKELPVNENDLFSDTSCWAIMLDNNNITSGIMYRKNKIYVIDIAQPA